MNLTMSQILALNEQKKAFEKLSLPIKTSYKLTKLFSSIDQEIDFYTNKMKEIITAYSQKDENGAPIWSEDGTYIKVIPEKMAECQSEVLQLNALEIAPPDISFSIEDFGEVNLSPENLQVILPFIRD
jgi:hypothetical protein